MGAAGPVWVEALPVVTMELAAIVIKMSVFKCE